MSDPFKVSHTQAGARGLQQIIYRQTKAALAGLSRQHPGDSAIHRVRKRIKAARGTLRLLRPAVGERIYRRENRSLRDAGRFLSAARDGPVLVKTLNRLRSKVEGPKACRQLAKFAAQLRRRAKDTRLNAPRRAFPPAKVMLRSTLARIRSWPPAEAGWKSVRVGLRHTYRKGRRAARYNARRVTTRSLHEWRKRSKYLLNQLKVISPVQHASLKTMGDKLQRLADHLGKEHDLAVLSKLARQAALGLEPAAGLALRRLITRRRKKLQRIALAQGALIYAEKPAHFEARVRHYFSSWPD